MLQAVAGAEVLRSPGTRHAGASEYLGPGHPEVYFATGA